MPMNSISRHAESSFKNGSPVLNEMDSIQRILLSSTGNQCKCMTTISELKMLILSVKKIRTPGQRGGHAVPDLVEEEVVHGIGPEDQNKEDE